MRSFFCPLAVDEKWLDEHPMIEPREALVFYTAIGVLVESGFIGSEA